MKKTLSRIVPLLALALMAAGCGGYNRILKSDDPQLKYDKALEYLAAGKYDRTIFLLQSVQHLYVATPKEDSTAYYIGLAYYRDGDFVSSSMVFDNFRQTYSRSPFMEDAEYMYAMGYYYASPVPDRDQTSTMQAMVAINEYIERYPVSVKREEMLGRFDELNAKLVEKEYLNAKVYYKTGKYKAAVIAFRNALNKYPDTPHREEMLYLIVSASYLLASNSVEDMQRERYLEVMGSYYNLMAEYPEGAYVKDATKMYETATAYIARFSDTDITNTSNTE